MEGTGNAGGDARGAGRIWYLFALAILIALTGYTRLTAPWQVCLHTDEMHHLESWRNHYRTDDIYPMFIERVESRGLLKGERLELLKRVYASSPLVQRGLIVLVDPQPPLFPVMAEIVEAVTHSNLIAARMISVIASILAVLYMFKLGRALSDRTLGLWLASLMAIGTLTQIYAGLARPYALAQFGLIFCVYVFVREQQVEHASPWRLWLAALLAQCIQWIIWPIVGVLVIVELIRRLRAGTGILRLVRQTWWYAALSVLMLPIMFIQLLNPTVVARAVRLPVLRIWSDFSLASPFAAADSFLPAMPLSAGAIVSVVLGIFGLAAVLADADFFRSETGPPVHGGAPTPALANPVVRWGLLLALGASWVVPFVVTSGMRFMMTLLLVPAVFSGIGAHWILRGRLTSCVGVAAVLVLFSVIRIARPLDPYDRYLWLETDYRPIAARLQEELGPDVIWCAYPYFRANCLYRFGEFPEPLMPMSEDELVALVRSLPREDRAVVVFSRAPEIDSFRVFRQAKDRWDYFNGFVLVKIPPRVSP